MKKCTVERVSVNVVNNGYTITTNCNLNHWRKEEEDCDLEQEWIYKTKEEALEKAKELLDE